MMQRFLRTTLVLTAAVLVLCLLIPHIVGAQSSEQGVATCQDWVLLSSHPLSELPEATQAILRRAVRSKVEAIIHDSGMGMSDTVVETVQLNAIEIARTSKYDALYIVAWDDNSFGVNGFNWLVEVKPGKAVPLLSDLASSMASGFGVKVLGNAMEKYPEIMIASKGFADGGGAIAEAGCFQKVGQLYENTPCPASCRNQLNPQ